MMKPISVLYKYAYMPPHKTVAAASSRSKSEALDTCVVLADPRVVFHPRMCGLGRGATAFAAALINYNDVEVATETTTRRRRS
jgi:hypothetical protein